jgi:hypothetical protein
MGHAEILNTHTKYSLSVYDIFEKMFMFKNIGLTALVLGAVATALGIAFDFRRLRIRRAGLSLTGWLLVCLCLGPLAAPFYLVQRYRAHRALVNAVWHFAGDASQAAGVRRKRLIGLHAQGFIGRATFRACLRIIDTQCATSSATNPDRSHDHK